MIVMCVAGLAILATVPPRALLADGPPTSRPASESTTEPTAQPTPQVLALVKDLTSDQFSVRQKAQQGLEEMGEPAIPQLQAILDGPLDDEARTRIRAAMRRIADQQQFGASVITIHCTDAPLQGVLEDFTHQAGADLGIHRQEIRGYLQSHKISLNLHRVDFWTALQAIEDASGLHARPDNDGRLILDVMMGFWMGQIGDRSLARVAGPCLIVPQSINWSMRYEKGNDASMLNLQIAAMIEPKLELAGSFQPNWLRECVDDKGHSLISPAMPGGFFSGRQWFTTLGANLQVVPGMGTKIARLKGELTFDVQTKSEIIEVDNILSAQNVAKQIGGSTIIVQQFQNENGQYQLHLLVAGPMAAPNSNFFQNGMGSKFQILDDKDQPLQQMGSNQSIDSSGRVSLVLFYSSNPNWNGNPNAQPIGPPKKMRCEFTTETRRITEPFELDDLPLLHAPDEVNH